MRSALPALSTLRRSLAIRTRYAAMVATVWLARPLAFALSVYTAWQETHPATQSTHQPAPVAQPEQPEQPEQSPTHQAHVADVYATPRLRYWARSLGFAVNDLETMEYYACDDEQAGRVEEPDPRGIQRLCRHMLCLIETETPHLQEELARAVTSMLLLIGVSAVEREMSGRAVAQSDSRIRAAQDEEERAIARQRAIERMMSQAAQETQAPQTASQASSGRYYYPHPPTAPVLSRDLTPVSQYGDTYHDTGEHRAGPFAPAR